jgi:DNA-binding CsgD family transcriptional regulator
VNDAALLRYILAQPVPPRLVRYLHLVRTDLSPAQRRILVLLADGYSKPQIARATGWSYETLKDYTERIRLKLGARNITHAVAIAIRSGIIG